MTTDRPLAPARTAQVARDAAPGPAAAAAPAPGASRAAGAEPVLALDIGGTKLAVAVVTVDGAVHGLRIRPTRREEGPQAVIRRLFDMGHEAVAEAGLGPVGAVGIACGGPLDAPAGLLQSPPHLPGWDDIPIGPLASQEFGVPFALENDATAAAVAEHRYGAGRGLRSLVYLTVSTGIGGGVILDGRLHRGAAGNGGELGHITVRRGGRACSCGRAGCIEAYASGTSIAQRAGEALAADPGSTLAGLPAVTAADVSAAAAAGDPLARSLWDETTDLLGCAVADLVNVLEPELVVLGGGVTRSGAMLLDPVRDLVAREAMPPAARAATVTLAALGDVVCVVGAGAIALDVLPAAAPPAAGAVGDAAAPTTAPPTSAGHPSAGPPPPTAPEAARV
ncbi:ROK family protein [Cellulomonas sp. ES6]|uniref:ROK family protein n=1 Tax=Cellulomonas sp. ES6 TaxID=3039384 RepID=UPI0024B75811|nr:ROK family protein [Cellulomonas sp. ES6]WHP16388.1 ROK family protein [Cellulomonas sp. ES6]